MKLARQIPDQLMSSTLQQGIFCTLSINPTPQVNDYFGQHIKIDGNYLAISNMDYFGAAHSNGGEVHVYNITTGALLHSFSNPFATTFDYYGTNLDIDNGLMIVGQMYADYTIDNQGVAHIYDLATGNLLRTLEGDALSPNDGFGGGVSISGNYAAVSATFLDLNGDTNGAIYIYDVNTGKVLQTITDSSWGNNGWPGTDLIIDENTLLVNLVYKGDGEIHAYNIDFGDADILYGGAENDTLYGLFGNEVFYGQGGQDTLYGGEGETDSFLKMILFLTL